MNQPVVISHETPLGPIPHVPGIVVGILRDSEFRWHRVGMPALGPTIPTTPGSVPPPAHWPGSLRSAAADPLSSLSRKGHRFHRAASYPKRITYFHSGMVARSLDECPVGRWVFGSTGALVPYRSV